MKKIIKADELYLATIRKRTIVGKENLGEGESIEYVERYYNTLLFKNGDTYVDLFEPYIIFDDGLVPFEPEYKIIEVVKIFNDSRKLVKKKN